MHAAVTIREGTLADIPTIAHHRRRMCEDMNYTDTDALSKMVTATSEYLKKAVPEGSFRSWLACCDGKVVAGAQWSSFPGPHTPTISNAAAQQS